MTVRIRTRRLLLRELVTDDAEFVVDLLNDPDWLEHIGDRGVRTPEEAVGYILDGPVASYQAHGFGLWLAETRDGGRPAGLCGLLKRDYLNFPDLGYALMPAFRRQGLAAEACKAVLAHARTALGLDRVEAIVSPRNAASIGLLEKLGFHYERHMHIPGGDQAIALYRVALEGK